MTAVISMLRGVNVGGHHKIKMESLRALCESLGLRDAQTYVQSGNVVFRTEERDPVRLTQRIEDKIEKVFGFRPHVISRTPSEMRDVIARNPFLKRRDLDPSQLLIVFLASIPSAELRDKALQVKTGPEELRIDGRELYIYFPNGMGQSKLSYTAIEKKLKTPGTGRNWNTVRKLLEMAEALEAS